MRPFPRRACRAPRTLLLAVPLLVLAACASGGNGGASADGSSTVPSASASPATSSDPSAGGGIDRADDDLRVELDRGDGRPVEQYRLTCAGLVDGTLPDAGAACAHLQGLTDPFAPLAADRVCAQVYGGPQTARITGRWHGSAVDLQLSRTDACHTAQWDSLGPLLPGVAG